jgi:hypothetical protein
MYISFPEGLTLIVQTMELVMSTFEVILDSVANPGKFTFITVEDCKDLEDCVNHIETEFSHEFIIDQIREVFA